MTGTRAQTTKGKRMAVYKELIDHTSGNLTKADLMMNKHGHVVSKKSHKAGLKTYAAQGNSGPKGWNKACKMAAMELGVSIPVPMHKGSKFHKLAKKHFAELKGKSTKTPKKKSTTKKKATPKKATKKKATPKKATKKKATKKKASKTIKM